MLTCSQATSSAGQADRSSGAPARHQLASAEASQWAALSSCCRLPVQSWHCCSASPPHAPAAAAWQLAAAASSAPSVPTKAAAAPLLPPNPATLHG